jgi:hypothetical protein
MVQEFSGCLLQNISWVLPLLLMFTAVRYTSSSVASFGINLHSCPHARLDSLLPKNFSSNGMWPAIGPLSSKRFIFLYSFFFYRKMSGSKYMSMGDMSKTVYGFFTFGY